jgi:hypothetical protein
MARFHVRHPIPRLVAWSVTAALGISLVGVATIVVSKWLMDGAERAAGGRRTALAQSPIGGSFGGAEAVFSGLALLLLIVALFFQQRELRLQRQELSLQRHELTASRDELRRSAEADLRGLHMQLTQMVMDDPSLAEVWNDFPGSSEAMLRQHLFANLTFNHFVLAYSWESQSEADLLAYARNLLRSPAFRRYWDAARTAKSAVPPMTTEGQVFRIFERAFAELRRQGDPSGGVAG